MWCIKWIQGDQVTCPELPSCERVELAFKPRHPNSQSSAVTPLAALLLTTQCQLMECFVMQLGVKRGQTRLSMMGPKYQYWGAKKGGVQVTL